MSGGGKVDRESSDVVEATIVRAARDWGGLVINSQKCRQ